MKERGDFTAEVRLLWISALAVLIGAGCAVVAKVLLVSIAFFTNLFFYQKFSIEFHSPAAAVDALGLWVILIPIIGGLIIGMMARFGSERIRGHGIPEALEAILYGQGRMQPKVAVLKPISSAISIGSGGPFGAEGPIIMTGGAVGSIVAQFFHLTAAERRTLLVAGAAGGMSATFATPLAALLLAVELLLFEWKPRSLIPVALASFVASLLRPYLLEAGPIFPVPPHGTLSSTALLSSMAVGLSVGVLSLLLTAAVYAAEDGFHRLPIHWMWWPAIGGLVVGIGGWFQPHALGVGYDIIEDLLAGKYVPQLLIGLIVVKGLIWSLSLGSGTSGGVLAPLLIMGGALGALESTFLPGGDARLWPLVGVAAALGGTMRSPLTGIVFALELTNDINALPALLIGSVAAYGFTVLMMKRSILTEKIARRGYHISREYAVDPQEKAAIADVMTGTVISVPAKLPVHELLEQFFLGDQYHKHQGYPVVDEDGSLLGLVTRSSMLERWMARRQDGDPTGSPIIAFDLIDSKAITVFPWETCRVAVEHMAREGVGSLIVVSPDNPKTVVGIVTRGDLLKARARALQDELVRERGFAGSPPAPAKVLLAGPQ